MRRRASAGTSLKRRLPGRWGWLRAVCLCQGHEMAWTEGGHGINQEAAKLVKG